VKPFKEGDLVAHIKIPTEVYKVKKVEFAHNRYWIKTNDGYVEADKYVLIRSATKGKLW
jgi:hypothetical protein